MYCRIASCSVLRMYGTATSDLFQRSIRTDRPFWQHHAAIAFQKCRPRCTVRTFHSSHIAGLGALYGLFIRRISPASVHCTDFSFVAYRRPRCTVRTFHSSHIAGLGALYGLFIRRISPASVHCTDSSVVAYRRPRCIVRTLQSSHIAGFGALYGC